MSTKFYIVWNNKRNEGFVTDSLDDAAYASSGFQTRLACSALACQFREVYDPDDEDMEFSVQEIVLTPMAKQP